MNLNDLAVAVTETEGKKVNLSIGQVKEVIRIMLPKLGLTKKDIKNKEELDQEHATYDKYAEDAEKYGQRVADYNGGFVAGQEDVLEQVDKFFGQASVAFRKGFEQ
jgi:hypothetical protein